MQRHPTVPRRCPGSDRSTVRPLASTPLTASAPDRQGPTPALTAGPEAGLFMVFTERMVLVIVTAVKQDLSRLVEEFLAIQVQMYGDVWNRMDIAAQIEHTYGPVGLHHLADKTGFAYNTLKKWGITARAFSSGQRAAYPHVSPEIFDTVRRATKHFPPNSRHSRPSTWLRQAEREHWTLADARAAVNQRILMAQLNSPNATATREQTVKTRTQQAEKHLQAILDAVADFNRSDAPYACVTLTVQQSLYHV